LLIPLGEAGITYIVPITASIIVLLLIVYFRIAKPLKPIQSAAARIRSPVRTLEFSPVYWPPQR
jgi:hypothetical protein